VRIYRDNFRVKPYGDPGSDKDWLGLNARRVRHPGGVGSRKGGWVLAENQVVGSIFITRRDNPALQDQTNREGLVENDAYRDMQRFVLHGIQFLERERQALYHREKGKTKPEVPVEQALAASERQLTEVATELRETAQRIGPIFQPVETTSLLELVEKVEGVATQIQESEITYSEEQTERQLMIGLATLGIAMTAFGHETARAVNSVLNRAELLRDVVKELPEDVRVEAQRNLQALIESAERIETWGQFALDRVRRDKRTQQNINVNRTIKTVLKAFQGPLEQRHIHIKADLASDLPPLRAFAMDIEAIFINFITNATEAMRHTALEDREIKVSTSYNKMLDEFQFCFCDSGRGIRPEDIDKIFDPLFSTKVDAKGKPVGTGLGLTIVNNVVASYNGRIEVEGYGQLGGAEFWIFLPHRYQRRRKND
jgi:signal transduction histidine kinase